MKPVIAMVAVTLLLWWMTPSARAGDGEPGRTTLTDAKIRYHDA